MSKTATAPAKTTTKERKSIDKTNPNVIAFENKLKDALTLLCTEKNLCGDAQSYPAQEFGLGSFGTRRNYDYMVPVTGTIRLRVNAASEREAVARVRQRISDVESLGGGNYSLQTATSADLAAINPPLPEPTETEQIDDAVLDADPQVQIYKRWIREYAEANAGHRITRSNANFVLEKLNIELLDGPSYYLFEVPGIDGASITYEMYGRDEEHARRDLAQYLADDKTRGYVSNGRVRIALPADVTADTLPVTSKRAAD